MRSRQRRCGPSANDAVAFGAARYSTAELAELGRSVAGSIGCANPVALAALQPGEDVLDLGSVEASTCCCRPASDLTVAPGLDMTPEMLDLARANQAKAG